MISLPVIGVISLVLILLSKEQTTERFVRIVFFIHGGIYGVLVSLFTLSYGAGIYMLEHSPQDALTFLLRDLLDGYALTITILGVVVYGLRTFGLLFLASSIRTGNKSVQLVSTIVVLITSISI